MVEVVITDRDSLKAVLTGRPRDVSIAIASRAALRVLPVVLDVPVLHVRLLRAALRANVITWAAGRYPYQEIAVADNADNANAYANAATAAAYGAIDAGNNYLNTNILHNDNANAAAQAAGHAAFAANAIAAGYANAHAKANGIAVNFKSLVARSHLGADNHDAAHTAAANAAHAADGDAIWSEISKDLKFLFAQGASADALLARPLWHEMPDWAVAQWQIGQASLSAMGAGFDLWIEWYQRRLDGKSLGFPLPDKAADEEFHRRLFEKDNAWWNDKSEIVHAEMAAWLAELGPQEDRSRIIEEILSSTASPQIIVVDGKIDAIANQHYEKPSVNLPQMLGHLCDSSLHLAACLHDNAPPRLKLSLQRYGDTIVRDRTEPVLQTLILCASIIAESRKQEDFEFWGADLGPATDQFLADHRDLVNGYPQLGQLKDRRAQLTINQDVSVAQAITDFVSSAKPLLEHLREAGVMRDRAYQHLKAQLDLGLDLVFGAPDGAPPDEHFDLPAKWTRAHAYAANTGGTWMGLRDNLGFVIDLTGHPVVQNLVSAITLLIASFV